MIMVSGSLLLVGSLAAHGPAWAQTRSVFINGQHISDAQLAALEQRACAPIPEGRYWLDMRTGHWGYAGSSRVQGVLGEACVRQQRPKSLSERRELYRPGEILGR